MLRSRVKRRSPKPCLDRIDVKAEARPDQGARVGALYGYTIGYIQASRTRTSSSSKPSPFPPTHITSRQVTVRICEPLDIAAADVQLAQQASPYLAFTSAAYTISCVLPEHMNNLRISLFTASQGPAQASVAST